MGEAEGRGLSQRDEDFLPQRLVVGAELTVYACADCGTVEGENPGPCCRKCGSDSDPISLDVEVKNV